MNPTEELVDLLDLERLDGDLFRGKQPDTGARPGVRRPGRRAGADGRRSAPCPTDFAVHSLHSYFLLPRRLRRSRSSTTSSGSATAGRS